MTHRLYSKPYSKPLKAMRHQQHTTTACTHYIPTLQNQALCAVLPSWLSLTAKAYVHCTFIATEAIALCDAFHTRGLTVTANACHMPTAAKAIALCDAFQTAESYSNS